MEEIKTYTICNSSSSLQATFIDFGARIISLKYYDNKLHETVLHYQNPDDYSYDRYFLGACIGRVAGHIPDGKLIYPSGDVVDVSMNTPSSSLHGGILGVSKRKWHVVQISSDSICFSIDLPDGEDGYPGGIQIRITYLLSNDNTLTISYWAQSDKIVPCSLSNHSYFDLSGGIRKNMRNVSIQLASDSFFQNDSITGFPAQISLCDKLPFMDLRQEKDLSEALLEVLDQTGKAFDHCYIRRKNDNGPLAVIKDYQEGIGLRVYTDQPCFQFYTSNATIRSHDGSVIWEPNTAICIEPHAMPILADGKSSSNIFLEPGQIYRSISRYQYFTI